jgi:hypothetical protein
MLPAGQRVEYKYVILEEQVSLWAASSRLGNFMRCWVGSSHTSRSCIWSAGCLGETLLGLIGDASFGGL